MAAPFPSTPVRETGTGADVNPLPNPPWGGIFYSDAGTWKRLSNKIVGTVTGGGSFNSNYLADVQHGFPLEVFGTLSVLPASGHTVWLDGLRPGGGGPSVNTPNAYACSYSHNTVQASTRFVMYHIIGGTQTAFNSTHPLPFAATAPLGLGFRVYANGAWELWYNNAGAGWTLDVTGTDGSPITGPFWLGGELESSVASLINFGGGQIILPKKRLYAVQGVQRASSW